MFQRLTSKLFALSVALQVTTASALLAIPITWDFDTPGNPGQPPSGWQDASQAMSPPATPPGPYQATTFDDRGVMLFKTDGNTGQRPKIRTQSTFETGIYEWTVYIPPMEQNAQVSLGAFLYSDQSGAAATAAREIDFEIGPGRANVRATVHGLPEDALLTYLTVQPDNAPGRSGDPGSSLLFQPSNPDHHIFPGNWYTLTIELNEDEQGRYVVDWYIEAEDSPRIKARSTYTTAYGPSNDFPTNFRIYNSLENLAFMGDARPTRDHIVYFDSTSYTPINPLCADAPTTPQLLTDIENDIADGRFPLGDEGEWTRFGAAYSGMGITTNPEEVDAGLASLRATADFNAASFFGVRYHLPNNPVDLRCAVNLTWRMRTDQLGAHLVRFVVLDADGDIWITNHLFSPTTTWETYTIPFGVSDFTIAEIGGNGVFDATLEGIGFDFLANNTSATTPSFFIDEITWESVNITVPPEVASSWVEIH